jgi:enoyl-CoA hydratase/carnithine racemase
MSVDVEQVGRVAVIRLRRPEVHNALDPETLAALLRAAEAATDDPAVGAVVLTGGPRAFSTGEDLRRAAALDAAAFREQIAAFQRLATVLRHAPKPTIAAVAGYAYGGGLELAVNCDARIAAGNARFACPEVEWGLTLTNGSSLLLRRLVGDGWARELLLFGRVVDAPLALRIGLVSRVVELDDLERRAIEMAEAAAGFSAQAVRLTKALLNDEHAGWDAVLEAETEAVARAFASDDVTARLRAFADRKRGGPE